MPGTKLCIHAAVLALNSYTVDSETHSGNMQLVAHQLLRLNNMAICLVSHSLMLVESGLFLFSV